MIQNKKVISALEGLAGWALLNHLAMRVSIDPPGTVWRIALVGTPKSEELSGTVVREWTHKSIAVCALNAWADLRSTCKAWADLHST